MGQVKNEVGHHYGRLTVLSRAGISKNGSAMWLCRCNCGNETVVYGTNLRSGHTQSCGCFQKERTNETRGLPNGEAAFNSLIRGMKQSAKNRNLKWSLTKDQVRTLTKQNCYYCDIKPFQRGTSSHYNGEYLYNGLDRIDNEKGYSLENVVSCCGICNSAKRIMTQSEFLGWISRVYAHSVNKGVR